MATQREALSLKTWTRSVKHQKTLMKMFHDVVENPRYQSMFIARALEGELHPSLEILMFHYILGKPSETIDLTINDNREDLTSLTESQLQERVLELHTQLKTIDVTATDIKDVN